VDTWLPLPRKTLERRRRSRPLDVRSVDPADDDEEEKEAKDDAAGEDALEWSSRELSEAGDMGGEDALEAGETGKALAVDRVVRRVRGERGLRLPLALPLLDSPRGIACVWERARKGALLLQTAATTHPLGFRRSLFKHSETQDIEWKDTKHELRTS
jgi:hypothetical protein